MTEVILLALPQLNGPTAVTKATKLPWLRCWQQTRHYDHRQAQQLPLEKPQTTSPARSGALEPSAAVTPCEGTSLAVV